MSKELSIDFETKSACELTRVNSYVYFDDPSTDVWCAAYAFDDEEPELWLPGQPCPPRVAKHIRAGGVVRAWNAAFERLCIQAIMRPRYGWPVPKLEQYRCVMTQAYAMGLPGKLEQAAPALKLDVTKDDVGKRIMLQLSKPRKPRKGEDPNGLYWWDDPEKIARLYEYCRQDVRTEQAIGKRVLPLKPSELECWFMDQRMNDTGTFIDDDLCRQAQKVVAATQLTLDDEMRRVTDMHVRGVSNVGELTAFLRKNGVETESVAKDELAELLVRDDLPSAVHRALEIRQEGAKTSVAKIAKLLGCRQADGRMRGNLQYHGASTGRWAARGAQLQNLPRPTPGVDMDELVADLRRGDAGMIDMVYGPPMTAVSDAIRGMIAAPPGRKIIAADFSQIEARVVDWLGGQEDGLEAFRLYDRKEGPDVYLVTAAGIYNVPVNSISKEDIRRQLGKVGRLSMGFEGGAMALLKMAKNYQMDISTAYDSMQQASSEESIERAQSAWKTRGVKSGVAKRSWLTAELVKIAWRKKNNNTVAMWKRCMEAAIEAVRCPGTIVSAGRLKYRKSGSWLFCQLPGKRTIAYAFPKIVQKELPWKGQGGETLFQDGLIFFGVDSFTKKWSEQDLYGGLLFQNAVQATARDIMAEGMIRVEQAGYDMIITIHDEVVAEADIGFGSPAEFAALMAESPTWADGLPIAADAWEGPRYRK